jgi:DNA-binding response OmpR family regulator
MHEIKQTATVTGIRPFQVEKLVLLIEDDPALSESLQALLSQENYSVIHAATLASANEWMTRLLPKAIVLDPDLPDGDGVEWLGRLRAENRTQLVPILLIGESRLKPELNIPLCTDLSARPLDENRLLKAVASAVQGAKLQTAKVLIVEDDDATRQILCHQLFEVGIKAIAAADGEQAMSMIGALKPDLIILDVSVPPPDGFALVEFLQTTAAKSTPLIVYTSLDLTQDDIGRLKLGSTKHLIKSRTSDSELMAAVLDLLTT